MAMIKMYAISVALVVNFLAMVLKVHVTRIKRQKFNFINSGTVDIIRTVYYIHGPQLMKLNVCRFIRVTNDGPYTLV